MAMDDVPPPEAFEPEPEEAPTGGQWRRRLQIAVILILVASLSSSRQSRAAGSSPESTMATPRRCGRPSCLGSRSSNSNGALSTHRRPGSARVGHEVLGSPSSSPPGRPTGGRSRHSARDRPRVGRVRLRREALDDLSPGRAARDLRKRPAARVLPFWSPDSAQVTFLTTERTVSPSAWPQPMGAAPPTSSATGHRCTGTSSTPVDFWSTAVRAGADGFFGEIGADGDPFDGTSRAAGMFRAPSVSTDRRYRAYLAADANSVGEVVREARDGSETTRIRVFGTAAMTFSPVGDRTRVPRPRPAGQQHAAVARRAAPDPPPGASEARTVYPGSVVAFFWSPARRADRRAGAPGQRRQRDRGRRGSEPSLPRRPQTRRAGGGRRAWSSSSHSSTVASGAIRSERLSGCRACSSTRFCRSSISTP